MRIFIKKIMIVIAYLLVLICSYGQSVNLVTFLPQNHVKDGSIDYTIYLQRGLNRYSNITLPNFPILINENGLNLKSNQTISFLENSRLIMKPNSKERYGLLNLKNVYNVVINNPVLEGDREKHIGKKGEWGMGINILSSGNIIINNPKISKFWGDGIYIGEIHHTEIAKYSLKEYASTNVTIKEGVLDNNRRNGISIISVKGLRIVNVLIKNSNGVLPMAGICIEPNGNAQFLEDIVISGVTSKNNPEFGIAYVPSKFYGKRRRHVSINLKDCSIIGSKTGLYLGGATAASIKKKIEKFSGHISLANCKVYSSEIPLRTGSNQKFNPTINMKSFTVFKAGNVRDYFIENKIKADVRARGIITD